jgi:catechol 2,3-dioxygenase-like lactoylglutathione lyase family enzyme
MRELVGIDHVQLAIPAGDEAERAAEAFYGGLLGLRRVPKPEPMASRGGCWFENGHVVVHLGVEEDFRPARKAHPAFRVTGFDELLEKLGEAGQPFLPSDEIPGIRRGHVDDPFGNRIELIAAD